MSKRFWYVLSSLVLITLLVSACQPTVVITKTLIMALSPTSSPTTSSTTMPSELITMEESC